MSASRFLVALAALALLGGCVVDRTGKSASYILQDRVDSNRLRVHTLEKDLAIQVTRLDDMADRAATSRQRLADSGATLETFLEEMQALRGEAAELNDSLEDNKGAMGAVEFRLAALEARLTHLEKELDITPPLILPPMEPQDDEPPSDEADDAEAGEASGDTAGEGEAEIEAGEGETAVASLGRATDDEVVVSSAEPSEEDVLFQQALLLMKKKDWEKAGSRLQKFTRNYPDSTRAVEAQYLTGQCLYELGRFKASITTYEKAIKLDEDGPFAPRSMFMQALAFEELGTPDDLEAAKVFFAELVRLYPNSDDAERAKRKLEALGD
ncbi:MAG: tetratricopeptide repeat protein [Deltaproteobacteria bacterium]|nr:tetratricopeptide repeat protein [Deltaproteobacteria bacterium]